MNIETIIIDNKEFKLNKTHNQAIQKLLDEIIILSKMIDKVKYISPIIDEHPSLLKIGYEINFTKLGQIKILFSTHHDYNYEEKKYTENNKIHCLTCHIPIGFSDNFFNFNNPNMQYRGIGGIKTTNHEAMIEILEEVKRYIVNI